MLVMREAQNSIACRHEICVCNLLAALLRAGLAEPGLVLPHS